MLTAFPEQVYEGDPDAADKMLVKPMHTGDLIRQLEALLVSHEDKKRKDQDNRLLAVAPSRKPAAKKSPTAAKPLPQQKSSKKASTPRLAKAR